MKIMALHVILLFMLLTGFPAAELIGNSLSSGQKENIPSQTVSDEDISQDMRSMEMNSAWYSDENMPWIIALIISIAGILINLLIANKQIRANLYNINANNRQAWVTDTRNVIASLITQVNLLNIEFRESDLDPDRKKVLHEKLIYNKNKLFLLLNPGNERHKKLMDALNVLMTTLDSNLGKHKKKDPEEKNIPADLSVFASQTEAVIEKGRNLLYHEWGKIQSPD
ncbi:MAG: hypothetical protein P8100_15940 [bacterium]|jgi:hypothetical protein